MSYINYHDISICAKSFEELSKIISTLIKEGNIDGAIKQIKNCIYYRMYIRHTRHSGNNRTVFNRNDGHDKVILQLEQLKRELIEFEKISKYKNYYIDELHSIEYDPTKGFTFTFKDVDIIVFYRELDKSYSDSDEHKDIGRNIERNRSSDRGRVRVRGIYKDIKLDDMDKEYKKVMHELDNHYIMIDEENVSLRTILDHLKQDDEIRSGGKTKRRTNKRKRKTRRRVK
jgi:hypothetical protein